MRVILIACLLALSGVAMAKPRATLNELLWEFLENLKEDMKDGVEDWGIPPMDPLDINETHILIPSETFNTTFLTANIDILDLIVAGVPGYIVKDVNFNILTMSINVTLAIPSLEVAAGFYTISAEIMEMIPIFGSGNMDILVTDTDVNVVISLAVDADNYITCRGFELGLKIGACNAQVTGLLNNEEFSVALGELLTDIVPDFVNEHNKLLNIVISPLIVDGANAFLDGMTLQDLIDMISPPATTIAPETS